MVIRPPLRVAVIGIDGAGKSSTTLRAIGLLTGEGVICKPGRDAFVQQGARREYCVPAISNGFERLFKRVDESRRRALIGASRLAFIGYQRWLEPQMIRRYRPRLILNTRCMIIDPAIYSDIYSAALRRFSLERKMVALRRFSGLPFRDVYVLLETPAQVALDRIHCRIAKTPGFERQPREYWLHLHESEPVLRRLGERFAEALEVARSLADFDLVRIETAFHQEGEVAERIANEIRSRLAGAEAVCSCA